MFFIDWKAKASLVLVLLALLPACENSSVSGYKKRLKENLSEQQAASTPTQAQSTQGGIETTQADTLKSDTTVQGVGSETASTADPAITATLGGTLSVASNSSSLNVSVSGSNLEQYRYKVGVTATTDCSDSSGYSAAKSKTTAITDDLSALPEGSLTLCVIGGDSGNRWQSWSSASTATWTKDTLAPIAVLSSVPTGSSSTTSLNIAVSGTGVATYRYKVGVSGSTDCSSMTGYSSAIAVGTAIQDDISALADGGMTICALGLDAASNLQAAASATSATWTKDTVAPTAVLSSVPTGLSSTTSLNIAVSGTGVATYRYKVGVSGSTDCSSMTGYSSAIAVGTAIQDDISALADGGITICALGLDAASNLQAAASATSGTWTKYTILALTVAKTYPINGSKWNDYIKNDNSGADVNNQADVACVGTETTGDPPCVHGGEKLKVVVTGYSSCTGLTASDQLGAFDWTCNASTNPVAFYSSGLKTTKGLADLITSDGSAFRTNSATVVLNGTTTIGTTTSTAWWSNTITALPDNSGGTDGVQTLSTASTIYVLSASRASQGYQITANKISVVILSGQTLSYGGRTYSNFASDCSTAVPTATRLICAGSVYFTWLEGALSPGVGATVPDFVLRMRTGAFYRVNRLTTSGTVYLRGNYSQVNDSTLCLSNSTVTYSNFYRLKAENCGISNTSVSYSKFLDVKVINASGIGFQSSSSSYNSIYGLSVYNAVGKCLDVTGNFNKYQKIFATNCLNGGINFGGDDNIVASATFNALDGVTWRFNKGTMLGVSILRNHQYQIVDNQPNNTFVNFYIFLSTIGFRTWSAGHRFENLLIDSLSNEAPLRIESEDNVFAKNMFLGGHHSNSVFECVIIGPIVTPGIDTSCQPQNSSTATVIQNFRQTELVGPTLVENIQNTADSAGLGAIPATQLDYNLFDWSNFDNPYQAWGITRTDWYDSFYSQPDSFWIWNSWNAGVAAGKAIVIDDLRPIADPLNVVRNHNYDMVNGNGTFTNGASCPAAVHGNVTTTNMMTTPRTFLTNAFEIYGDSIGNDDGLCESNEACIYAPNFGSYQGEGDYTSLSCTFQNGTVSSVTMYAYPRNGVTSIRSVSSTNSGGNNQIDWNGSTSEIAGYLVVRRSDTAVNWAPTDGTNYTAGTSPDGGTHQIVYRGPLTTFTEATVGTKDFYQIVPYYSGYYYGVPKRLQVAEFSGPATTGYTLTNPWGMVTVDGETYLASQPGATYASNANYSATSPTITVASSNVSLNLTAKYELDWSFDYFYVEVSTNGGGNWTQVASHSGNQSGWYTWNYDLAPTLGASTSFIVRFRLTSNGSVNKSGVKILNFNVTKN